MANGSDSKKIRYGNLRATHSRSSSPINFAKCKKKKKKRAAKLGSATALNKVEWAAKELITGQVA